jgi:hypothetical protein
MVTYPYQQTTPLARDFQVTTLVEIVNGQQRATLTFATITGVTLGVVELMVTAPIVRRLQYQYSNDVLNINEAVFTPAFGMSNGTVACEGEEITSSHDSIPFKQLVANWS